MFKHILVPIDGSEHASNALETAASLARDEGATCTVCMVVDIVQAAALGFATPDLVQGWLKTIDGTARELVDEAAAKMRAFGVTTRSEVIEGNPADAILEVAKKHRVDLIVMGSHGRSGLGRIFLGSVAESVLRRSPVPVLVVRRNAKPLPVVA